MNVDRVNDRVSISNQGIDRSQLSQPNDAARSAGKDRQVPAGSDSVALSSQANELNRLGNTIEQSRMNRLNQVRAEIESGSYQVSAEDLTQKLIDSNLK
jgi:flagellar biosynthesis anti-sigma factor FlgM